MAMGPDLCAVKGSLESSERGDCYLSGGDRLTDGRNARTSVRMNVTTTAMETPFWVMGSRCHTHPRRLLGTIDHTLSLTTCVLSVNL